MVRRITLLEMTVNASTGATIKIWRQGGVFHAERLKPVLSEVQICSRVDLFEVVAELADLDLDNGEHVAEAVGLAEAAERLFADADDDRLFGSGSGDA